ncbi:MAG TPA: hypothetical protein VGL59_10305 [Polyangia bacterium]
MKRLFPLAMLAALVAVAGGAGCGGRDHAFGPSDGGGGGKKADGSTPVTDAKGSGGSGGGGSGGGGSGGNIITDGSLDLAAPDPDAGDAGKPAGATCASGAECDQGICADGVCCRTSCTDLCHSCNISGSAGTCVVVPSGQAARASECTGDGSKCGKTGACDGAGACAFGAKDTVCADAACDPTTYQVTAASQCDGKGACMASGQKVSCAPAKCNAGHTGCANPCTSSNDCVAPNQCQQGTCGQSAIGVACTGASQCQTGNCVDGVCCDKPCAGQCEACDNSGALGTCKPASGTPHHAATPARAACGGDPACAGKCDGSNATTCVFAANVCRSYSCASGAQVNQATCDPTNGACPAMTTTSCQFVCVAATGMCGGSCKPGAKRCATNVQTCATDGVTWTDSEVCGSTKVCSNNACVTACVAGVACTDGIGPCRAGKTACATPTSAATCQDSGADDNHNTCTGGKICSGGACVTACVAGAACRPSACHSGKTVCSSPTATPTCSGSTVDDTQGGCSGTNICVNGGCVAPCVPRCTSTTVYVTCNGNNQVINVCDPNTMCDTDSVTCVPCGQQWGQKCCPNQLEGAHCMAGPESFCLSGICTSTGHLGEPCFPGGSGCKDTTTTVCKNNVCVACGEDPGNICCQDDSLTQNGCNP